MKYKIKDLAKEISLRENKPKESEYERFVGLEHYDSGEMKIHRFGDAKKMDSSAKKFKSGDILIARRNVYLRRAGMVDFDGLTSGDSIVIRANNEIYQKILPFVFNTNLFWEYATKYADGTMSKRLSPKLLMEFEIELPNSNEKMEELSNVLWSISSTLDAYSDIINKCDNLIEGKFNQITSYNYETKRLEELTCEWFKGQQFKKEEIDDNGKNMCIHYGELFTKYGPHINEVISRTNKEVKKGSVRGDILFPASDVTPNGLARCTTIDKDFVLLGGDIIVLRPKNNINSIFLSYAINYQKTQLLNRVTGSVVKHISSTSLKTVEVPIVSKDKQDDFELFALKIENIKNQYIENTSRLKQLQSHIIYNCLEGGKE